MSSRMNDRHRNEPSFGKGVALVATGLAVSVGLGAWAIGSREQESETPQKAATKTNASRPAWAKPARSKEANTGPTAEATASVASAKAAPVVTTAPAPVAPASPPTWEEAQAAWDTGDYSRAAGLFERYTNHRPANPWGHYMQGLSLRHAGDLSGAEVALLECLAVDPLHDKALVNLARVRIDLERAADALDPVQQVLDRDDAHVAARRVLARALHTQGLRRDAEAEYLTVLAHTPDDAWSLNNLGLIRIEEERFAEAVSALERACGVDDGQALFFNNLGIAYERSERFRAAEEAFARALELDGSFGAAEISLARVSELGGDSDDALPSPDAEILTVARADVPELDQPEETASAVASAEETGGAR